jgi:hypothetical protein
MELPKFEQASQLVLGTAPVHIDQVQFHPSMRDESREHVDDLIRNFARDLITRWAHPIEVVLTGPVTDSWKEELRATRKLPHLPTGAELVCVSGKHRLAAAKRMVDRLKRKGKQTIIDGSWLTELRMCGHV